MTAEHHRFSGISRIFHGLLILAAAVPGWSAPAPPDWILIDPSDEPGFWVVIWPSVADADGYQIYLQIGAADIEGDQAPEPVLARWGYVEQQDGMIRVKIAGLSQETFSFGVATVKDGVESEITWPAQPSQPSSALAPPDSVWVEEYGEGIVVLAWTAVPGADGYRIYGEVLVTVALNSQGEIVPLESPEVVWVSWGYVDQQDSEIIRATIPILDEGPPALAVAAEKDGVKSEIAWPPAHPDFNRDGQVNLLDFFLLADAFGSTLRGFDLDRDGRVDLDDYFLFANAFQTGQWQPENATPERSAATETVYMNGRIHTQDQDLPWAESLVTRGDRIVLVGSDEDALRYAGPDAKLVDLQGRFVMPGIIDAHTHPGLISIWADLSGLDETVGENEEPAPPDRMPSRPREATLAWVQQYADDYPWTPVISQGVWDVAAYLPDGPHRRDLDEISSVRPILLYDNSGHSVWVNSAMLRLLGIDRNTPDLSENLSYIVRDETGEPTGWLKEFVLTHYMGGKLVPSSEQLKERMLKYLNYMSSKGITTLWDAGNFNMDDAVYQVAHDIAREGDLPLRWEGSYHIWAPDQIDLAAESLLRLRARYSHGKLQFNTVKIHYDGMQDILTAGMLEPYVTDPDNYGGVLFTPQRLSRFMQELDGHGIDLHLHAAGDRATRNILDAVEQARAALGRPLGIEVTLSHLFSVADSDIERFPELNVHANFTPHWFGGTVFGEAREINVGPERAGRSQLVGHFVRRQASVSLSSDAVHNPRRVNPFIGIEMSITRRAIDRADAAALPPFDAGISLEQALAAYTVNGAAQLGLEEEIGALKAGLLADFIVLPQNPFATDVETIHAIEPSATIVAGELRSGSL